MSRPYDKRTRRIEAWGVFFESFGRNVVRLIWLVVFLIILVAVGKYLVSTSMRNEILPAKAELKAKSIVPPVQWDVVDKALAQALNQARAAAEARASSGLDPLVDEWMVRVDQDFLPWYFSYWNQQKLGLEGIVSSVHHWIDNEAPTAAQAVTETVQEEFAVRVLRPQITQIQLEQLTHDVVNVYVAALQKEINTIPQQYNVPVEEWDRYLSDMALLTSSVEGNRQVELSLKAITGTTLAGTVVLGQAVAKLAAKLGSNVSAEFAGKAAAKMAAKTGGKVAAKLGGKLLGPIVGVGIIIWDLWDHASTKETAMPVLRQNLQDYLQHVKETLLHDSESGVMSVVDHMEANVLESIASKHRSS